MHKAICVDKFDCVRELCSIEDTFFFKYIEYGAINDEKHSNQYIFVITKYAI